VKQGIVLDVSVLGTWWLQEPQGLVYAETIMLAIEAGRLDVAVPPLFFDEALNILLKAQAKGRLSKQGYEVQLMLLKDFQRQCRLIPIPISDALLELKSQIAQKHSLRSYDVNYLYLAQSEGLVLATLDDRLTRAARLEGCYYEPL